MDMAQKLRKRKPEGFRLVMNSRNTILDNIRRSLTAAKVPSPPSVQLPSSAVNRLPPNELAAKFTTELTALSGTVLTARADDVPDLLVELLTTRGAKNVLAWDSAHLPVPGALETVRQAGIEIASSELPRTAGRTEALLANEPVRVGITGVEAAIADTGTLVVMAGAGRSRLAYMSVRTHIALIAPGQLYGTLAEWQATRPQLANELRAHSTMTFITGPSRTADIEMTLTVGVHGPGEVIAVLITDNQ